MGTASTVRSFLLVECPGPWGTDVPHDTRLPAQVKGWLAGLRGWRTLLIRRGPADTTRVFTARGGSVATAELPDVHDLPSLDLGRDLTPYDGRLYLVCTHGRHDVCCAERGRPLWSALTAAAPEETWQVSHIGGDRFAANVLVLPDGLYFGRLTPEDVPAFVEADRSGSVDLDHLRGRCALPFSAQAAEVFLRRELGETRRSALRLESIDEESVVFAQGCRRWQVDVVRTPTRELLTCRATRPGEGWTFSLGGVTELR